MQAITQYEEINATNILCTSIHYCPFDPIHGLNISKEDMVNSGYILVDNIPSPEVKTGMDAQLHFNPEQESFWYEYVTRELSLEEQNQKQIASMQDAIDFLIMGGM